MGIILIFFIRLAHHYSIDSFAKVFHYLLLLAYSSPQNLLKAGDNLYSGLANAGPLAAPVAAGNPNVGSLQAGALEMSNVDLAGQLTSLIITQRAYEANTKVITTSDEMLQTINNLKR